MRTGRVFGLALALHGATCFGFELESSDSGKECTLIEEGPGPEDDYLFHYKQNDENLDPNKLYLLVHKIVFSKRPNTKKITLDYSKVSVVDQHTIGEHFLTADVQEQMGGELVSHCYQLKYTVHDIDECTNTDYSKGKQWVNQCDPSATCENTIGGYNCVCPGDYFGTRNAGGGACGGLLTTEDCCGDDGKCKADFVCHTDHCSGHKCHKDGYCIPGNEPNAYTCACNEDYVGDGFSCEFVNYCKGGSEPKCPKGCSCVSHSDRDGFTCPPKPGYVDYVPPAHLWEHNPVVDPRRLDTNHICVDDSIPTVVLLGQPSVVLTQGDTYTEKGLRIEDDNTADLKRSYSTDYHDAGALMDATGIKPCGKYEIVYSLATPWLKTRPNITVSRQVEIVDVDECTYDGPVTEFHHACVSPAVCENKLCEPGDKTAYSCTCPYHGYVEDGHTHGCTDMRNPVVRCVTPGCDEITLYALKMDAVIQQGKDGTPTLLASSNSVDAKWVHKQLEAIYKTGPPVDAYDLLWDETIENLSKQIEQHPLEIYDADKNIWALPFTVKDAVGNVGRLNIMIQVELVDADTLMSKFAPCSAGACHPSAANSIISAFGGGGGKKSASKASSASGDEPQISRFNLSLHLFGLCAGLYLASAILYRAFRATQCLVAPKTLMYQQASFEQGMNFLLFIQSLGSLDEEERAKIIKAKWDDLQMS
jgi:hypothetical protein